MKLLNRRQLGQKGLPSSKSHIWRALHNPDPELPFPPPIRIGRNTFWVEEEIDRYLIALVARRDRQRGACQMTKRTLPTQHVGGSQAALGTDQHRAARHPLADKTSIPGTDL